jgi:hypothetical protein
MKIEKNIAAKTVSLNVKVYREIYIHPFKKPCSTYQPPEEN